MREELLTAFAEAIFGDSWDDTDVEKVEFILNWLMNKIEQEMDSYYAEGEGPIEVSEIVNDWIRKNLLEDSNGS